MVAGVFRFITDKPGYLGAPTYPTWETALGGGNNTDVWYEDFIVKSSMSNPSRSIDITNIGQMGSVAGFEFTIRNDIKFWNFIETTTNTLTGNVGLYLTGCNVVLYCVLDGVFYQIFEGKITNDPYTETDYKFACQDIALLNPTIPNDSIDLVGGTTIASDTAKMVPVCIGKVPFAELIKKADSAPVTLIQDGGGAHTITTVNSYTNPQVEYGAYINRYTLTIYVKGITFAANYFYNQFVYVNATGTDATTPIRITGSTSNYTATGIPAGSSLIDLHLESAIQDTSFPTQAVDTLAWSNLHSRPATGVLTADTAFVSIASAFNFGILSQNPISSIFQYGKIPFLKYFDNTTESLIDISGLIESIDLAGTDLGFPLINYRFLSDNENSFSALLGYVPQEVTILNGPSGNPNFTGANATFVRVSGSDTNLTDKNRTTGVLFQAHNGDNSNNHYH
jgi:hypothetical protein